MNPRRTRTLRKMGREANCPSDVKTVQPWGGGGGADSSVE